MEKQTKDVFVNVSELHTTHSTETANRYLGDGWVLLSIATGQSQTGPHDYTPEFAYCLGKLK
jgi:hypothetical protein